MKKQLLFMYAVLWHPTEKQTREENSKSKILSEPKSILAPDLLTAQIAGAMEIPTEYKNQLDQIEIITRPF